MYFNFATILVVTVVLVGWSHFSSAINCNGDLSGPINEGVVCTGDCVLNGATVTGSVDCSTGTLLAKGNSNIAGNVLLSGVVTRAELVAVTVSGVVDVKNAGSLVELVIQSTATLGSVKVDNTPGDVLAAGSLTDLTLIGSGNLFADDLSTISSISVQGGNGIIELCGSSIGGGLSVTGHTGDVEINANKPNCGPTTLTGGLTASGGSGSVTVIGADLSNGDFSVSNYNNGDVTLEDAQVSDVILLQNTGSLTMSDVDADSDTSITNQVGNVVLSDFTVLGDTLIKQVQGAATLSDSNLNFEDVSISLVSGTVTVENNINLQLTVMEVSGMVEITGNVVGNGNVNKNTGGVQFLGNTFQVLSCTDNNPAPSGSGNTIVFGDGQCASGL